MYTYSKDATGYMSITLNNFFGNIFCVEDTSIVPDFASYTLECTGICMLSSYHKANYITTAIYCTLTRNIINSVMHN